MMMRTFKILIMSLSFLVLLSACKESSSTSLKEEKSVLTKKSYTVAFNGGGIPFEGGSVEGVEGTEGISCNRMDRTKCSAVYPEGSKVKFRAPLKIKTVLGELKYAGKVRCNGVVADIAASGSYVTLYFASLKQSYTCSFLYAPI